MTSTIIGIAGLLFIVLILWAVYEGSAPINSYTPMSPDDERKWLRTFNLTEKEIDEIVND